jgi:hypothetical protein
VLVLACFLLIPGCSPVYKARTVRHTPVNFERAESERTRPTLYVRYIPAEVDIVALPFRLPEGKGMLYLGKAVKTSYAEALSAYFQVSRRAKYADFYTVVDFDAFGLDVSYAPEEPRRGEPVTIRIALSHTVSIRDMFGDEVTRIPLERHQSFDFLYSGPERVLEMGVPVLEKMLEEMERQIFEELKGPWEAGAFKAT